MDAPNKKMHRVDPPDYLERFPMLDIAKRGWDARREIVWRNELREETGRAWTELPNYEMRLVYEFSALNGMKKAKGSQVVAIIPKYNGTVIQRPYGLCLGCAKYVGRLFYRNTDWLCSTCQGLRHRTSFLTPAERRTEELDGLRHLEEGRPPGMRERAYQAALERKAQLRADLEFTYKRPSSNFLSSVSGEWV